MTVPIILAFVAVVISAYRISKEMMQQRRIAIEKGVKPLVFTVFTIAVALYSLPNVAYFIFRLSAFESVWFPILVLISHTPALLLADTIGDRLEKGYDYHRKAVKRIKEAEFAGYISLSAWLSFWVVAYFFLNQE